MSLYFGSLTADLVGVLCLLLVTIYLWFRHAFSYWERQGVPYLPPTFPFGNMKRLALRQKNPGVDLCDQYNHLRETYGHRQPYAGLYLFNKPMLLILDLELVRTIFIKEFSKFPDRGLYFNEEHDPLSAHMFAIGGAKWKKLRHKISPTFTSGKMKMMFETLAVVSDQLRQVLHEEMTTNAAVDVKDLLARFTTDIIGSCVFGLECNSLKDPQVEFRQVGNRFIDTTLSNSMLTTFGFFVPGVLRAFNVTVTDKYCADFFMRVIKDNIEYREKHDVHRRDFMDLFIRLKNNQSIQDDALMLTPTATDDQDKDKLNKDLDTGENITLDELAAQAFAFFIAGFETSSTTSAICLFELAQNPNVQERLRADIKNTVQKHNGQVTYESIMEMKYLDMVVNETLRKYPIAPNLVRVCRERCVLEYPGNTPLTVEPGTLVALSILGIHRDPVHYPNPKLFDPERFTEQCKATRHPNAYLPFGEGPRNCVGMRFALLQIKVALVQLLKDHSFSVSEGDPSAGQDLEFTKTGILLFPKDPIMLKVKPI